MHRPWHDRLDAEMKRRGVPAKYRRRFLAEASDHADDLTEGEAMNDATMEARMGQPGEVAATAADQYRRGTWTRRHPLIVFGLLPVPLMVLLFVLIGVALFLSELALAGVCWATGVDAEAVGSSREITVGLAYTLAWSLKFLPFVLLAWFFTRRFIRSGVHWGWYAAAMAQLLFLAGTFFSTIWSSDTPGESSWTAGFAWIPLMTADGWRMPLWSMLDGWQVVQLLAPASLAWLMVRLAKRRQMTLAV